MQKDIKKVLKKMSNERESETEKLAGPGSNICRSKKERQSCRAKLDNNYNLKAFAIITLLILAAVGLLVFIFVVLLPELGVSA
jgi:hypothetical protein